MVSCKIRGCKNRSDKKGQQKLHFYSFPKDLETASKWIEVCKETVNIKNSRVCSVHFKPSCYKPKPKHLKDLNSSPSGVRTLLPDAIPTEAILTDDINRQTIKCHKSISRNLADINVNNKNVLNVLNSAANKKISTVLYLPVLENNNLQPIIKCVSTPLTYVKNLNGHPNLDVRLERFEAPAHILDHQYAINNNLNSIPNATFVEKQNNSSAVYKTANLEISTKSNITVSDREKIEQLKKQLQIKTLEYQAVQKQLRRLQNETKGIINKRVHEILKNVFSPRQIDKLINPYKSKVKWSIEDIISAVSLHNISLKAYRYLRENNYPLPGLSTIRKWTANIKLNEGLLTDILTIMKYKANSLSIFQKIVVLNFCEFNVSQKKCQICIVRGLFYKWIQPIYYSFNKPLSANIIKEIIEKLSDIEYIVVAIVSNFKSFDDQIWKDLNIGVRNNRECYFLHPKIQNYKIFVFPSESNLLALLGQIFFNNGFIVRGKCVNKQCIEEIAEINRCMKDENIYRLTPEMLENYKSDCRNSSLVKKLFSKAIATEIFYFGKEELIVYNDWREVADFFELFGRWIDLCNSQVKQGFSDGKEPYGLNLECQNNILNNVVKLMHSTKMIDSEQSFIFQDQVILKCNSIKELLIYLQETFSIDDFQIKYILTARFGSDLLNNLVEYLSDEETSNDISVNVKFQNKLRKCLIGKHMLDLTSINDLKLLEPCLIDFNEKSDTVTKNTINKKGYASGAAGKIRRFLTVNNISKQRVHKNLLHILSKEEEK